jgi:aminoglycoside 3-N-acetyltransferase
LDDVHLNNKITKSWHTSISKEVGVFVMEPWKKEREVVEKSPRPITLESLSHDLKRLGLARGDIVIVHSSLSKIGWVVGAGVTVISALMDTVTTEGTIVMPAHTTGNGDPENWNYPSVPKEWWQTIRDNMPPFIPHITPTRNLGRIPEIFRTIPGVVRSSHPQVSFSAWGKEATTIVESHELVDGLGRGSPLQRLYDLDGRILLLGVDHESNTSLHLAESLTKTAAPRKMTGAAFLERGARVWKNWEELAINSDDFNAIGYAFESSIKYQPLKIGLAESRLLPVRELVDFAAEWMDTHRYKD